MEHTNPSPYSVALRRNSDTLRNWAVLDCDGEVEATFFDEGDAHAWAARMNSGEFQYVSREAYLADRGA